MQRWLQNLIFQNQWRKAKKMTIHPTSIIVCTHNRVDMLPNVIGRLRAQEYPAEAFEIIVVDNGSTDHTAQVVEELIADSSIPVRYVAENRPGVTFARNRGAEMAHYPYLAYLDDDCSVEPDWLSQLVQGFDLDDAVVAVGGRIVLDWSHTERPAWLGSGLEPWLAANSYLGSQPRLLDKKTQIMENNMALKREAWQSAGGFLGMELFGSRHMAAGEVLYLLQQLRQQGGQIAFVPQAVALHRMGTYTRRRFLQRGYWQGVSAGILDYLIYRRSWLSTINHLFLDIAAMLILLAYTCFSYLKLDQANGMFYLVRTVRRFSLVLSEMRLVGDWPRIRSWVLADRLAR
jgi:glycosyltransferase involved in cell wall biosynthesis